MTQAKYEYPYCVGLVDAHIKSVVGMLELWRLKGAPCMISEDGTALQMRLDITYRKGKILVFGLCGGSFEIVSTSEFVRATSGPVCRTLASSLYAYTLIPLVRGAPHIPFFAWCHDSTNKTFSTAIAIRVWQYIWQVSTVHQYYMYERLHSMWCMHRSSSGMMSRSLATCTMVIHA